MHTVISIHQAKTQLSRLIKMVEAGQTVYIGAYGKPQVMLTTLPEKRPMPIGIWKDKKVEGFSYASQDLIGPDAEIVGAFERSLEGEPA